MNKDSTQTKAPPQGDYKQSLKQIRKPYIKDRGELLNENNEQ